MRSKTLDILAFRKGVPSLFVVASPLQLLCAIEASKEFCITESKYILVFRPDWPRNSQVLSIADMFKLDYEIVYTTSLSLEGYERKQGYYSDIDKCTKYNRVYIGDYSDYYDYLPAFKYVHKGSFVVYLDDGTDSLSFFQGKTNVPKPNGISKRWHWLIKDRFRREELVRPYQKIIQQLCANGKYYAFTIFGALRSGKFIIYPNNFANVAKNIIKANPKDVVLIVGSVYSEMGNTYQIPQSEIESIVWKKMMDIRNEYTNTSIIFIPHGRDNNTHIKGFCEILDIKYQVVTESVELFAINRNVRPIAVYGQGTTALLTFKLLFPNTKVVNWFFDKKHNTPFYYVQKRVSDYYVKNGILVDTIKFREPSLEDRARLIVKDIKSIISRKIDKFQNIYKK